MKKLLIYKSDPVDVMLMEFDLIHLWSVYECTDELQLREIVSNVDVLVIDIGNGAGIETIEDMRKRTKIPIIVITAFQEDIKGICLNAGANYFLQKPYLKEDVLKIFNELT